MSEALFSTANFPCNRTSAQNEKRPCSKVRQRELTLTCRFLQTAGGKEKRYPAFTPSRATDGFPAKLWSRARLIPEGRSKGQGVQSSAAVKPVCTWVTGGRHPPCSLMVSMVTSAADREWTFLCGERRTRSQQEPDLIVFKGDTFCSYWSFELVL